MDSFCGESFLRVYDKMLGLGAIWAASLLGPGGHRCGPNETNMRKNGGDKTKVGILALLIVLASTV